MYFYILLVNFFLPIVIQSTRTNKIEIEDVYFLISTSTKIYCLKTQIQNINYKIYQQQETFDSDFDSPSSSSSSGSYLTNNYEIIYEELNSTNNWITDLYYDSIDNQIYVNIYNSITLKSDIIQLRHDKTLNKWTKYYLFRNQNHCLGITYNPYKNELYWTSGKLVMVGKIPKNVEINKNQLKLNETPSVLFNIELTKKLLYLKYDYDNNAIYASTLNFIYVCFIGKQNCNILIQNMQSARGIYLDSLNNYLYTVDHKKKQIDRVKVGKNLASRFYPTENQSNKFDGELRATSILNSNIMPDIGDIFYVCLYKQQLLWTEFSGKLKSINIDNTNNYDILFTTNEYTYAIVLMNNLSYVDENNDKILKTTTPSFFNDNSLNDILNSDLDAYDYIDLVGLPREKEATTTTRTSRTTPILLKKLVESTYKHKLITLPTTPSTTTTTTTTILDTTSTIITSSIPMTTTTTVEITTTIPTTTTTTTTTTSTSTTTTFITTTTATTKSTTVIEEILTTTTTIAITTTTEYIEPTTSEEMIEETTEELTETTKTTTRAIFLAESTTQLETESIETTLPIKTEKFVTTRIQTSTLAIEENENKEFDGKTETETIDDDDDDDDDAGEDDVKENDTDLEFVNTRLNYSTVPITTKTTTTLSSIKINLNKQILQNIDNDKEENTDSMKITATKATTETQKLLTKPNSTLNIMLYIITCLLCFSIILNLILFYFTRLRSNRGKLILNHDSCDSSEHQTMKNDEIADIN